MNRRGELMKDLWRLRIKKLEIKNSKTTEIKQALTIRTKLMNRKEKLEKELNLMKQHNEGIKSDMRKTDRDLVAANVVIIRN